jgi:hypothetical protein
MYEKERGPKAYNSIRLRNQHVWDSRPERATEAALDALEAGGFGYDCISREVGNYEGQIMAIRRGWAEPAKDYGYIITDDGYAAWLSAGRDAWAPLPALDTWHNSRFFYRAITTKIGLKLFKNGFAAYGRLGMDPVLTRADVIALRDYLNLWLDRNPADQT